MAQASAKRDRSSAQNSVRKAKRRPRGKPFAPANSYAFKSKENNGGKIDPRINPGGRPKLLGESYKAWLEKYNESVQMTNAEAVATAMGLAALRGDVGAAREIRTATEGEMHVLQDAWKQEVIDLLKSGTLNPKDVIEAIGLDDARSIFIAAGIAFVPGASEQQSAAGADSTGA